MSPGVASSSSRLTPLPPDEVAHLASLSSDPDSPALRERVTALRAAGWSLQEISVSLDPPLPRSTIRSWEVAARRASGRFAPDALAPAPAPAPSADKDKDKDKDRPVPSPPGRSDKRVRPDRSDRLARDSDSPAPAPAPSLPPDLSAEIARLAPLAAKVRAGTSSTSRSRRASDELDSIVSAQLSRGVTVAALARAAGVSHRAMSTRAQRIAATNPHPATPQDAAAEAAPPAPDDPA